MTFHVGQKVVCVDDHKPAGFDGYFAAGFPWIEKGEIYTVAGYAGISFIDNTPCIHLADIRKPQGFRAHRFRPLVDISDLAEIVAEVKRGKPRTIAPDKFDRQKVA